MYTSDEDIHHIARGIIDRTLPKAEWTHAAHVAAGVWLIAAPDIDAERDMPAIIHAYNEATGTPNTDTEGYHETITLASLRMTRHIMKTLPVDLPLHEVVNRVIAAGLAKADWIFTYWSRDVLFSVEARRDWVEPDLTPLPQ